MPDWLGELANLRRLHLEYNRISTIPDSFRQLSGLSRFYLHGNPGLGIPEEILGGYDEPRHAQDILRFYFAQREGSKPLSEAKSMLVRSGGVGKTSPVAAYSTVVMQDKTLIKPSIAEVIQFVQPSLTPVRMFLSYSRKDEKHLDELRKDLKVMERGGLVLQWYDRELSAGEKWKRRRTEKISPAGLSLCPTISRPFASDLFFLS